MQSHAAVRYCPDPDGAAFETQKTRVEDAVKFSHFDQVFSEARCLAFSGQRPNSQDMSHAQRRSTDARSLCGDCFLCKSHRCSIFRHVSRAACDRIPE